MKTLTACLTLLMAMSVLSERTFKKRAYAARDKCL